MPTIKIQTVVAYVTPIGFHQYASDFATWAERAHAHGSKFFSPVPYYLYCRSLELVLKAFLLAKGVSKKQLKARSLGHDLTALLTKAKKLGLEEIVTIKPRWDAELSKANEYYSKKDFEYFNVGFAYYGLPSLSVLQEFSDQLLQSLKRLCLDAADAPSIGVADAT